MWDVRPIRADEAGELRQRLQVAFGVDSPIDEDANRRFLDLFDLDRTLAAYDEGSIVGTAGALSLGVTVPGGAEVAMGGTSIVSVQPTHRRRGVLREMMRRHLEDLSTRGEPLAGLWASESSIYGRFGYGPATYRLDLALETRDAAFLRAPLEKGRLRMLDGDRAEPVMRSVFDQVRPLTPGMLTRSDAWWAHRVMRDDESMRGDKSARRYLVHETDGVVDGYATYRQKENWEGFIAAGEIEVIEIAAVTGEAREAIWRFLVGIDLASHLEWWNAPADEALTSMVADHRRVRRRLADALWIRLLDVPSALAARRYSSDGQVVMAISDHFLPEVGGVFRLEIAGGEAICARVDEEPEVSLDIDVLGHLYLGGGNAVVMAEAGRLEGDASSISLLHRAFLSDRAPYCQEIF